MFILLWTWKPSFCLLIAGVYDCLKIDLITEIDHILTKLVDVRIKVCKRYILYHFITYPIDDAWSGVWNQGDDLTSPRVSDFKVNPPAAVATPGCIAPNIIMKTIFSESVFINSSLTLSKVYLIGLGTAVSGLFIL